MNNIHERIKESRTNANLTQQELADYCGVERTAVSQWENASNNPKLTHLFEISKATGATVTWLLTGETDQQKYIPISEYVDRHNQAYTATMLGLTQGAISKMLRVGRNVYVIEQPDGSIKAIEERLVGANTDSVFSDPISSDEELKEPVNEPKELPAKSGPKKITININIHIS
jgi:transcriptional regulator with XRE-family HTH domain